MYGLGTEYKKIAKCAAIHSRTRTPWIAVIAVMLLSMAFALIGDIEMVAEITNFSIFAVFAIVNASLIAIRYKLPPASKGTFRVPLNIGKLPVLALFGIVASLFMLGNLGHIAIVGGALVTIIGYFVFTYVDN